VFITQGYRTISVRKPHFIDELSPKTEGAEGWISVATALHISQICGCKMHQHFCSRSQVLILQNIHQWCKQRSASLGRIMLWKLKKVWWDISKSTSFLESYKTSKTSKILPILLLIVVLKKINKPSHTFPKRLYPPCTTTLRLSTPGSKSPIP